MCFNVWYEIKNIIQKLTRKLWNGDLVTNLCCQMLKSKKEILLNIDVRKVAYFGHLIGVVECILMLVYYQGQLVGRTGMLGILVRLRV